MPYIPAFMQGRVVSYSPTCNSPKLKFTSSQLRLLSGYWGRCLKQVAAIIAECATYVATAVEKLCLSPWGEMQVGHLLCLLCCLPHHCHSAALSYALQALGGQHVLSEEQLVDGIRCISAVLHVWQGKPYLTRLAGGLPSRLGEQPVSSTAAY